MVKQEITNCRKGIRRHKKFNEDELNKILNEIISKTSLSKKRLNIGVGDFSDSSKDSSCTKIDPKGISVAQEIILRIILEGCSQWWKVLISIPKDMQVKSKQLSAEFKEVIKKINEEYHKEPPSEKRGESLEPFPDTEKEPSDSVSGDLKSVGKKRIKTSEVITEDVITKLLKMWIRDYDGTKIFQREFSKIVSEVAIASINKQVVVNFLEKKGIIKVFSVIERKPQLEITDIGRDILERYEQQKAEEEKKKREEASLKKLRAFPGQAHIPLGRVNKLLAKITKLAEAEAEVADAKKGIEAQEKRLAQAEASKLRILKELENAALRVNAEEINNLVNQANSLKSSKS